MLRNKAVYKYETPYKGPYKIIQCWKNGPVTLQMGATKDRLNLGRMKPYKY